MSSKGQDIYLSATPSIDFDSYAVQQFVRCYPGFTDSEQTEDFDKETSLETAGAHTL